MVFDGDVFDFQKNKTKFKKRKFHALCFIHNQLLVASLALLLWGGKTVIIHHSNIISLYPFLPQSALLAACSEHTNAVLTVPSSLAYLESLSI